MMAFRFRPICAFVGFPQKRNSHSLNHPEGTSIVSDNLRFVKSFWYLISIVVNADFNILNDTAQFREEPMEIYI